MLMIICQLLTFSCHLLKVNHCRGNKEKRSSLSIELKEDYMSYIQNPSNLLLAFYFPSTLIGSPLRLQPSCFYLRTLQPHFPYQYYLCHFDKHKERDVLCMCVGGMGGQAGGAPDSGVCCRAAASGFYSSSIFSAGVRLRLDVMSRVG